MANAKQEKETFPKDFWQAKVGTVRHRCLEGQAGRYIVGRLLPGADLVTGIIEAARAHGVKAAYVDAFGSLSVARYSEGVRALPDDPTRVARIPPVTVEGPLEFLCGQGKVAFPEGDDPIVHFHGVFVTPDGAIKGGHFFQGDNPVFATFEIFIQEILGVEFAMLYDEEAEVPLIEPVPAK